MANAESIENTASTVEMATTKVERTTSTNASAITGRTAWDALVDIGRMLGRYTPWIIMLAGAAYGFYQFAGLQQKAKETAQAAAKDQIDRAKQDLQQAQEDLRNTYKQIGDMHKQQLENLLSMLNVNKQTAESTEQQRSHLNRLQEEIRNKLEEAEKARNAADRARYQTSLEEKRKVQARIEGERARIDLENERRELSRQKAAVEQRTIRITDLRGKLIDMAKSMVGATDSSVATLGQNILKEDSLEANKSLAAYANQPGKDTAESLDDLVGSSEETLETALSQGLGFTVWHKYSMKDGTLTEYIGVVRQTDVTDEGVVLLTVREKKVVNVEVFPKALSIVGRDPDDWNKQIAYNLYLRPTGEPGIDLFEPKGDRWKIPETMTDFAGQGSLKEIYGSDKPLYFMSFDDFKKEAEIYESTKASYRGPFSDMVAMLENEKGFDANKIVEPFATKMPKGIRDTFVQLLRESVKRADVKSVEIASASKLTREVYGPIAAAALKPDFKIEDVGLSQASTVSSTKGETCFILCGYRTTEQSQPIQHARLTFTREGSDDKWMLLDFEAV